MTSDLQMAMLEITTFYGTRRTVRQAIQLMDHITQGITILEALEASDAVKSAFALHPLFQDDASVATNWHRLKAYSPEVVALVLEYRNVANQGLRKGIAPADVKIPVVDVVSMLIADKVQNRSSFRRFLAGIHPEENDLEQYFTAWLKRLGITEERYESLVALYAPKMP